WHRGQVGQHAHWHDADLDIREAQRLLDLLTLDDETTHKAQNGQLGTLSLADRFDAVLHIGRRIASALSTETIYEEAGVGATRLLRGETAMVLEFAQDDKSQPQVVYGPSTVKYDEAHLRQA